MGERVVCFSLDVCHVRGLLDFCNPGVGVLKPVGNLLLPWAPGFPKLADFIKYTTCGSIRESFLSWF